MSTQTQKNDEKKNGKKEKKDIMEPKSQHTTSTLCLPAVFV